MKVGNIVFVNERTTGLINYFDKKSRLSNTEVLIGLYFLFQYIAPIFFIMAFGVYSHSNYKYYDKLGEAFIVSILCYILFLILSRYKIFEINISPYISKYNIIDSLFCAFSLLFLFLSLIYNYSSFRYGALRISDYISIPLILYIIFSVLANYYCLFTLLTIKIEELVKHRKIYLITGISVILSSSSFSQVFISLTFVVFVLFPNFIRNLVLSNNWKSNLYSMLTVALIFIGSWQSNELIKYRSKFNSIGMTQITNELKTETNLNIAFDINTDYGELLTNKIYFLVDRTSINLYSLGYTIYNSKNIEYYNNFLIPFNGLLRRSNILFNFKLENNGEVFSIMRKNYLETALFPELIKNAGTAPGLLGSFNYVFKQPYSYLFCAIYLVFISYLINIFLIKYSLTKINLYSFIIIYFLFFESFFQSPFDSFLIFDIQAFNILIIIIACFYKNKGFSHESPR